MSRALMQQIAASMGKPELGEQWANVLEANLYQTVDDLRGLTLPEVVALQLPSQLFRRIQAALGDIDGTAAVPAAPAPVQLQPTPIPTAPPASSSEDCPMQDANQLAMGESTEHSTQARARVAVSQLREETGGSPKDEATLGALIKILENIINSPDVQSRRSLRTENAAFHDRVGRYPAAVGLLNMAGFELQHVEGTDWLRMDFVNEPQIRAVMAVMAEPRPPIPPKSMSAILAPAMATLTQAVPPDQLLTVLSTLKRIVGNIIAEPENLAMRCLRVHSEGFHRRVGRYPAALDVLVAIGFTHKTGGAAEGSGVSGEERLEYVGMDVKGLGEVMAVLTAHEARTVQMQSGGVGGVKRPFNPHAPMVVHTDPAAAKMSNMPSTVDMLQSQLSTLKGERARALAAVPKPDRRPIMFPPNVMPPRQVPGSEQGGDEGGGGGDGALLSRVLKAAEQSQKINSVLRTSAMKQVESLQKTPLYGTTVILVTLPDRTSLHGSFHVRETVEDLYNFIRQHLRAPVAFTLLDTSRRMKIPCSAQPLDEAQLTPAARLHLTLESGEPGVAAGELWLKDGIEMWDGSQLSALTIPKQLVL